MSEFLFFIIGTMLGGLFVNRYIKHRHELNEQLQTWILPLIFDCLQMSRVVINDAGKLLSGHTLRCSRFLNCLSYRRKIEVKVVVSCVHKLTTYPLKILLLYFTEMRLLIERCEISCNRICNLRLQET